MHFLQNLPKDQALRALAKILPELDPTSLEVCHTLFEVAHDLTTAHAAHVASFGLSRGRYAALMSLAMAETDVVSPSTLAANLGVTPATITGLLDGLAREELVSRANDPEDRRRIQIRITDKGRRHIKQAIPAHARRFHALVSNLDEKEKQTLVRLLGQVGRAIRGEEER